MVDKSKHAKNMVTGGPIKRTVAGGILGATVGYLASPENGKKLLARVDKEALKDKSTSLGQSAKEKSKLAVKGLRTSTTNFLNRNNNEYSEEGAETEVSATAEEVDTENLEDLREENQKLQDRLKTLEEKMNRLLDSEDDEEEENTDHQKKSTSNKQSKNPNDDEEDEEEDDENEVKQKKEAKKSTRTKGKKKTTSEKSKKDEDEEDTSLTSDDDTSS